MLLKCFELARGTGGAGRFRGGDGVLRELQFREEMVLSVLSERRALRPYGLQGEEGLRLLGSPTPGGSARVPVHVAEGKAGPLPEELR